MDQFYPDDSAVDKMAEAMKDKMALSRSRGRKGWHDPLLCSTERLNFLLTQAVIKGDPVDVANYAMMLHERGEKCWRISWATNPVVCNGPKCAAVDGVGHSVECKARHDAVCEPDWQAVAEGRAKRIIAQADELADLKRKQAAVVPPANDFAAYEREFKAWKAAHHPNEGPSQVAASCRITWKALPGDMWRAARKVSIPVCENCNGSGSAFGKRCRCLP